MAVFTTDSILDASIDYLINNGDSIVLLDEYTTDYVTAAANALGSYAPTITKGDAVGGGRAATVAINDGVEVTRTGTFTLINYAIVDTVNEIVLLVGEVTKAAGTVSNGDFVNMPEMIALGLPDLVVV